MIFFTIFIALGFFCRFKLKSQAIFELTALIKEEAVEIIAAKIAQPVSAVRNGLDVFAIDVISMLPFKEAVSCVSLAKTPKEIGITQIINVIIPAKRQAFETIFEEAPAKHLCAMSCSIIMKRRGISSHPKSFPEIVENSDIVGMEIAARGGCVNQENMKIPRNRQEKKEA